tara:strand:- start:1083 stop:2636 length:1554 start_codon:yes stop_codon:yes gene_type:complete
MAEGYRSRHNVSRQFTEAEDAVSDRTTEHLTQDYDRLPPARMSRHGTASQAYGWLEKDLANRDKATARLSQEFSLANRQSQRLQLGKEAEEEAIRKNEAAGAIQELAQWQRNDFNSFAEARQSQLESNPRLASNPEYNSGVSVLGTNNKSPRQREIEEVQEKNQLIAADMINFETGAVLDSLKDNPELADRYRAALVDNRVTGVINKNKRVKAQEVIDGLDYDKAIRNRQVFDSAAQGGDEDSLIAMETVLGDLKLDIDDSAGFFKEFEQGSPIYEMFAHPGFMKSTARNVIEEVTGLANILTNEDSTNSDKLSARKSLRQHAGRYMKYTARERDMERNNALVDGMSKEVSSFRSSFRRDQSKILVDTKKKTDPLDGTLARSMMAQNFIAAANRAHQLSNISTEKRDFVIGEINRLANEEIEAIDPTKFYTIGNNHINVMWSDAYEAGPKGGANSTQPASREASAKEAAPTKEASKTKKKLSTPTREEFNAMAAEATKLGITVGELMTERGYSFTKK